MKWISVVSGDKTIWKSGRFRTFAVPGCAVLEHPDIPLLTFPNIEMCKKVAAYMWQGGVKE